MGNKQDTTTKFFGWFYYGSVCQEVTPREIRGSHSDKTPCLLVNSYRIFAEALLTPPTGYNHTNTTTDVPCVPLATKPGWLADRCSVSQQLGALQTHSFSFPTQRTYFCSNFVAISSFVLELLKKCRVR